jgi:GH24 family phage-related lysozyme (muramidase)
VRLFYSEISLCISNPNIPAGVQASLLELAFNVGSRPVCRSTMMRLANAGQYRAACEELHRWGRAGGKRIRGLQNRRADSKRVLCLKGLT